MANTNIRLTGLDFENLKSNFKTYLQRSDSPFKDIEYEGSNINALLDVLAYNTYINSFYLNMAASEMFLDSAILKDSVISHAKELNYLPRSYRSSEAIINFSVTPASPLGALLVPKGTSFTTKLGSNNYSFTTNENIVLSANSSGDFNATNISIYEGRYVVDTFVYSGTSVEEKFILSNPTIDTRSISVVVLENDGANTYTYTRATSFLDQQANSQIYFLQAAENEQYEILFGDNVIGRKPQNGATVVVEYRVCNGELPNGAAVFFIDGPIQGQANISTITTVTTARGGGVNESVESIKFNAPRSFQNQDRAITTADYENLLKANFTEIQAASAYGGEEITPPQYGRVFVAVDLFGADGVPDADKTRYASFLQKRTPIGLTPIIVDPEFLYNDVETTVRYNTNVTTKNVNEVRTLVQNAISNYNQEFLEAFGKTLRCSKLAERIAGSDPSIVGIDLAVHPFKKLNVLPRINFNTTVNFGYELQRFVNIANESDEYIRTAVKSVYTTRFVYNGKLSIIYDDGAGKLFVYEIGTNGNNIVSTQVGTVDYTTGTIVISNLLIDSYDTPSFHLHANPLIKDVPATKNSIIRIDDADVTVNVVQVVE